MTALLPMIAAVISALQGFLPEIPELITLVKNIASLLTQTTPITGDQEAGFWANALAAHAALQAIGGPTASALAPVAALAPAAT